ncbi:MAG: dTDP-glucose 4,6-dehydratase [Anaerolineae bacterium]
MTKTILVTGGCGFIGSNLVRLLCRKRPHWRVVNLDKLTYAGSKHNLMDLTESKNYRFVKGDVAIRNLVFRVFEEEQPQYVIHLAAESHVDRSILDPAPFVHTNVAGTQVLLEAARAFKVERFLYISTDEVYGDVGAEGLPCSEESIFRPASPYAASKAAADLLAQAYHRTYLLPILIARPCNHYGPYQFPEKLIPFMIRNILRGDKLPLYGDGQQRRDWLYVEDGARALLAVLEQGKEGQAYNVAAQQERPNKEVLRLLCKQMAECKRCTAEDFWATVEFVTDRPGHDFRYAMNNVRLQAETGWFPQVTLEEGLKETVEWYLSHQDWLERTETGLYREHYDAVYVHRWEQK